MAEMIVTIDGPAGVGKSTVSRMLAKILGAAFLDTGAMYRALTLAALRKNVDLKDTQRVLEVLQNCEFEFTVADDEMRVAIDGQLWGKGRMLKAAKECLQCSADQMVRRILAYRRRFVGLAKQIDDTSIVAVKIDKNANSPDCECEKMDCQEADCDKPTE